MQTKRKSASKRRFFSECRRSTRGHWSLEEQSQYLEFIRTNATLFQNGNLRDAKVFKQMERAIRSRTAVQCRSHHQKMIANHRLEEEFSFIIRDKPLKQLVKQDQSSEQPARDSPSLGLDDFQPVKVDDQLPHRSPLLLQVKQMLQSGDVVEKYLRDIPRLWEQFDSN